MSTDTTQNMLEPNKRLLDEESKNILNKAELILSHLLSQQLSSQVIKKIPTQEYLRLVSLINEIISGSVDEEV